MMLPSIVIPTRNMSGSLRQAIESVLRQTYRDFELIVVDDASQDATGEIVATIRDPRLHLIRHQEKRGPSAARNTGILNATGDCVAFLDADDIWLPEKLERQVDLLSRQPSVGFVYCGTHEVDASLRFLRTPALGPPWPPAGPDAFIRLLKQENCVVAPLSTMMLRRACLDQVGLFDETIVQAEEFELLLHLAYHWDIAFVPEPLVLYRMTGCFNPEKRLSRRMGEAHETSISRAFERLGNPPELDSVKTEALLSTYWLVALYHYAVRQPEQAKRELDKIPAQMPDYLDFAQNQRLRRSMAYVACGLYDTVTPLAEALDFVGYAFDHFPALVRHCKSDRRKVNAEVAAITAFDNYPRGEAWRVWNATCLALLLDPSFLRNRGLLKLPFRTMFHGHANAIYNRESTRSIVVQPHP
jgi:glycosyltransferase involved in cell wall biosynthesis